MNTSTRQRRNDVILICVLLTTLAMVCLGFFLFGKKGSTVTVYVGNQVYGTYSLEKDTVVDIDTGDGNLNRLVIRDGKAFVETASCPDGVCAAHFPISRKGESISCRPHRVTITVTDGEEEGPDAVV